MKKPIVVVTREEGPRGTLREALARGGADVRVLPTTRTAPPEDPSPLREAFDAIASFDWLALTSARSVDAIENLPTWRDTWARPRHPRVAAVGSATAARLREAGAPVDLVGPGKGGADLAHALVEHAGEAIRGTRVLWPRSDRARPALADGLRAAGAAVAAPIAYRTLPAEAEELRWFVGALGRDEVDAIAFLSPSAATSLAALLDGDDLSCLSGTCVASIGPSTSAELSALGAAPDIEAVHASAGSLAEVLLARVAAPQGVSR